MLMGEDAQRLFTRACGFPRDDSAGLRVGYLEDEEGTINVLGDLAGYGQVREFIFSMSSLGYQPLILGEPEQMRHCDFVFARPGPRTLDTLMNDWLEAGAEAG